MECDPEPTGACAAELACKAPEADSSGPLQSATVAATAHRMPTAMALPLGLLTGTTLTPKHVEKACAS